MNGTYDTAQICENDHVITSMARANPQYTRKFCSTCGEKTITSCQDSTCNAPIKGYYTHPNVVSFLSYQKPNFCDNCGTPYPWTFRANKAASELIDLEDNIASEEKESFKNSIADLTKDSANSTVAVMKYRKFISKAGKEFAGAMKDILVDVVSESVKKSIWGQ